MCIVGAKPKNSPSAQTVSALTHLASAGNPTTAFFSLWLMSIKPGRHWQTASWLRFTQVVFAGQKVTSLQGRWLHTVPGMAGGSEASSKPGRHSHLYLFSWKVS